MLILDKVCAGYNNIQVLHNISFSLEKGQSLSIIGPNGCGKTTLLKAIANILPFSGEILLDGNSIKTIKQRDLSLKIAMFSQLTNIYFSYNVFDTVMMGRYAKMEKSFLSKPFKKDIEIVEEVLNSVGMYDFKNREIDTLSGGQLQRVFLAKTLAQEPDIILLDEPTNHLDLSYQVQLINFLKEWAKDANKSVIGVLHDINLAMMLSDDFLLLNNGKIEAFDKSKNIIFSQRLNQVYNMNVRNYMIDTLKKWDNLK